MRVNRFGIKSIAFYGLMLTAFYATPYSNPFFLLLGFLSLVGGVGVVSARRNLRGVTVSCAEPAPVASGLGVRVAAELQCPASRRLHLDVHLELEGGRRISGHVPCLERRTTLMLEAAPLERGCYRVEGAVVESCHPFGLVTVRNECPAPCELIVYPSPHSVLEGRSAAQALDELLGTSDPGAGELQPSSLRDHRDGDDVRAIHWRASARRGHLVVQEWEGSSGHGLEASLDRRCKADELEVALATISAMVELARTNKETLRLHSQGLSATYGEGHLPYAEALRFLACAEVVPPHGPAPPPTSPTVARLPRALSEV